MEYVPVWRGMVHGLQFYLEYDRPMNTIQCIIKLKINLLLYQIYGG